MYQLPGKHIALAFSDPAGANACQAIAAIYRIENQELPLLFSNRKHFADGLPSIQQTDSVPDWKALGIDCLFTGTSHPQSSEYFEVACMRAARAQGIYTVSFIDHWVNFRLRFAAGDELVYPDEIWVVDTAARTLAIAEGLPEARIHVTGNPYHYYLKQYWKPAYSGKSYLQQFGIPQQGIQLLFAPDPLSIRNGKETAGFTEADALDDVLSVVSRLEQPVQVLIKAHPLQPIGVLQEVLEEYGGMRTHFIQRADVPELIHASDCVIGFYSNLLLEAAALGKKVIRYFPGHPEADLLLHSLVVPAAIKEKAELYNLLNWAI